MMMLRRFIGGSICSAMLCTAVSAQNPPSTQNPNRQPAGINQAVMKPAVSSMLTPQQLASCLALDNQEQVILGKFAQDKFESKEVAAFAKMLIEEHQSCLKKLSKFAPDAAQEGYLTDSRGGSSNDQATTQPPQSNATPGSMIDAMQLQREIAQQCIADSKEYLSKKEGAEFDKCFVGTQLAKHAAMHSKLTVLQRHTSDELKQMVTNGIKITATHMQAAEKLMASLDSADENRRSTRSGK
jgi:predicted outer membrane protein